MPFTFSDDFLKELIAWSADNCESDKKYHITRVAMYASLRDRFAALNDVERTILSVSRSNHLAQVLGLSLPKLVEANYPEHNFLNLSAFADESFDFCISDQVLEHVEGDPFLAFRESVRILKPGGFLCHTTCFINPVHAHPNDFWRFTPDALKLMAAAASCDEVSADGWGNKDAWALVQIGLRRMPLPSNPKHPLYRLATKNDKRWPLVVWITARKPLKRPAK